MNHAISARALTFLVALPLVGFVPACTSDSTTSSTDDALSTDEPTTDADGGSSKGKGKGRGKDCDEDPNATDPNDDGDAATDDPIEGEADAG